MITALEKAGYVVKVDESAKKYCGLTIDQISPEEAIISMPEYVPNALKRFGLEDIKERHTPGAPPPRVYGKRDQVDEPEEESPPLSPEKTKLLQEKIGVLLYLAIMVKTY